MLVTHEHELSALADRRISLRDGRVVSDSDVKITTASGSERRIDLTEPAEEPVEASGA
jgi:ABC-type lipoprotein export system ATPase subunit